MDDYIVEIFNSISIYLFFYPGEGCVKSPGSAGCWAVTMQRSRRILPTWTWKWLRSGKRWKSENEKSNLVRSLPSFWHLLKKFRPSLLIFGMFQALPAAQPNLHLLQYELLVPDGILLHLGHFLNEWIQFCTDANILDPKVRGCTRVDMEVRN